MLLFYLQSLAKELTESDLTNHEYFRGLEKSRAAGGKRSDNALLRASLIASLIATLSWPKYYYNQKGFTHTQKDSGFGDEQILEGLRQQPALQRSLCNRKREPSEQENGSQRPWTQNDLLQTVEIIILIIWITTRLRAHETI